MKWSETVDPSVVQGIPGVVSENSRPFFVVPRVQTDVLSFAAAGCTERETALRLGIATATVRGHLVRVGARSTCPQATHLHLPPLCAPSVCGQPQGASVKWPGDVSGRGDRRGGGVGAG